MATLDWSQCPALESIPGKRSGAWVFRDTRTPVSTVFEKAFAHDRQKHPVSAKSDGPENRFCHSRKFAMPVLRRYIERVLAAVDTATPGSYAEVGIPFS